jgi:hypothetical protein
MGLLRKMRTELVQGVTYMELRKAVTAFGAAMTWQHDCIADLQWILFRLSM